MAYQLSDINAAVRRDPVGFMENSKDRKSVV